jgi:hypothetical protein
VARRIPHDVMSRLLLAEQEGRQFDDQAEADLLRPIQPANAFTMSNSSTDRFLSSIWSTFGRMSPCRGDCVERDAYPIRSDRREAKRLIRRLE